MTDDVLRDDIVTLATLSAKYATAEPERKQYQFQLLIMHLEAMERRHGREETLRIMGKVVAATQRDFGVTVEVKRVD